MVLYKYLNYAVDKIVDAGHATSTDCNTNYRAILLMMLSITPLCKPLKTDPLSMQLEQSLLLQNTHPDNLMCVC